MDKYVDMQGRQAYKKQKDVWSLNAPAEYQNSPKKSNQYV